MYLTKSNIPHSKDTNPVSFSQLFELPVKVMQFGTGVLLRALPDYFIDKANKQGVFNGRIVVVKSTDSDSSAFDMQDGLYTVCERGIEGRKTICEDSVNASISKVLSATSQWDQILSYATLPSLKIIISNTTEVGIQFVDDNIFNNPPTSFPGKLLAVLWRRYEILGGTSESGLIILPTELITDNGQLLKKIVIQLAQQHNLPIEFIDWINSSNYFCNTLVDRIVPGKPPVSQLDTLQKELGYVDSLLTMSEVFRLWAIEGDEKVKRALSFHQVDSGVVITPDINVFKELKLRLLNGTHTFNSATAFLCGFDITRDAVTNPVYGSFTRHLMFQEIASAIPLEIDMAIKREFANRVFERFCNPFIDHQWKSIAVQISSKMQLRNVPLLVQYFKQMNTVPVCMATGFAAYILYMKAVKQVGDLFYGVRDNVEYLIHDSKASVFHNWWTTLSPSEIAKKVCTQVEWWGTDLTLLPGFLDFVTAKLLSFLDEGVSSTIAKLDQQIISAE